VRIIHSNERGDVENPRLTQTDLARTKVQNEDLLDLSKYILQKRPDCGKCLLARGRLTVAEVAARAGFTDTIHFHLQFKRRFGITPGTMMK